MNEGIEGGWVWLEIIHLFCHSVFLFYSKCLLYTSGRYKYKVSLVFVDFSGKNFVREAIWEFQSYLLSLVRIHK